MASSGKKKTTMGKLNRERRLRERRLDKQARKDARKQASLTGATESDETTNGTDGEVGWPGAEPPALEAVAQAPTEP